MSVKKEIFLIEKNLYKVSELTLENYYGFLNNKEASNLVLKIFEKLKNEDNFSSRKVFKDLEIIFNDKNKLDCTPFSFVKNFNELLYFYCALFIVKSFQVNLNKKHDKSIKNPFNDSNQNINWCSNEFLKLCLFFSFITKIDINLNDFILRDIFSKLFFICSFFNLIEQENINYFGKTYKLFNINIVYDINYSDVTIFTQPLEIFENSKNLYSFGGHFSTIFAINRKNEFSGFKFKQNVKFSEELNQHYFYIDQVRLNKIVDDLLFFHNLTRKSLECKYIENQVLLKKYISEKNWYGVSEISREISIFLNFFKLITISNLNLNNQKIYVPHILCFRGRFYMLSDVSHTFIKELRFCSYVGYYQNIEQEEKYSKYSNQIKSEILQHKDLLKNCNLIKNLNDLNELEVVTILFLMINIAEFEKIKLGKQVTLKQFIEKGIEVCNNINLIVYDDVFDKIQVEYYVFIVTEVLTKSKKKWLAAKDATASYCQHLIKILGPNNINSYKLCNLDSLNTWYDTYTFIIDSFLITQELIFLKENDVKKWLSRKLLKKTIMTEAYGISFLNAKKEYFLNNQSEFLNKEQLNELNIVFKSFFKYLETNVLLFKQSPKKIINSVVGNNLYEINLKGGETTNLNYFRKKIFQKSYYFNGKRTTKQEAKLTSIQDLPKIKIALRANYVQLQESSVARIIVLKTGCPVVHDCFTIDYFNIPFLVSEVNVAMNLEFHDLGLHKNDFIFFSIFIIL